LPTINGKFQYSGVCLRTLPDILNVVVFAMSKFQFKKNAQKLRQKYLKKKVHFKRILQTFQQIEI
jgi:hypothetical protein